MYTKKAYEPLKIPLPPYPYGKSDDVLKHELDEWFAYCEWSRHENNRRFEKAMKRIQFCAFLRGFLNPFSDLESINFHYSWCPGDKWHSHLKTDEIKIFEDTEESITDFKRWSQLALSTQKEKLSERINKEEED